jgi:uncharacterized protein (DUF2147 family)
MRTIAALYLLSGLFCSFNCGAQNRADDITGIWLTTGENAAKIQIYNSGGKYYGKIAWLKNPTVNGKPILDANNPDKNKRSIPVIGLVILTGFKFDGDDEWTGGNIYDPVSGKTYSSYLYLKNRNTLKIRGYIGISLFGRTETWTRTN